MGWGLLAGLIAGGGFFGGVIDLLHKITYKDASFLVYDEAYNRKIFFLLLLRSGLVGVGGALGLCALRIYAGEFEKDMALSPINVLFNFTLSVIAGFAARTLLPNIASRLERQFDEKLADERREIDKKMSKQEELIKTETEKQMAVQQADMRYHHALSVGTFALGPSIESDDHRGRFFRRYFEGAPSRSSRGYNACTDLL